MRKSSSGAASAAASTTSAAAALSSSRPSRKRLSHSPETACASAALSGSKTKRGRRSLPNPTIDEQLENKEKNKANPPQRQRKDSLSRNKSKNSRNNNNNKKNEEKEIEPATNTNKKRGGRNKNKRQSKNKEKEENNENEPVTPMMIQGEREEDLRLMQEEEEEEGETDDDSLDCHVAKDDYGALPSAFSVVGLKEVEEELMKERKLTKETKQKQRKTKKPGIIYLSSIPPGYNVSQTTMYFSQFGKVGRVFLQPDLKEKAKNKDKMARNFVEGWIEFVSKRVAKEVASSLNNTQVGGKKRSKAHDVIWNIKYLPKFKWTHLTERLAYEKHVHQQRMRNEISQAKREAEHFKSNMEKSKRKRRNQLNKMEAN